MGEGGDQKVRVGEAVADPRLDLGMRRLRSHLARRLGAGLAALLLRDLVLARGLRLFAVRGRDRRGRYVGRVVDHRTILKMRFQRTVQGQRQSIQACSFSATEKKIIWAR